MKNNRNLFLSLVLGIILFFGSMGIAQAQPAVTNQAITSFYNNEAQQLQKVEILEDILGYTVVTPFSFLESNPEELGDGTFQQDILDFQQVEPLIPGTDAYFSITAPLGTEKLYSVVAGKPDLASCPIQIDDTQVVFVEKEQDALDATQELVAEGYLVYVTPDKEAQRQAIVTLAGTRCLEINGLTKEVTVDFQKVFSLLPPRLQQPAKLQPFIYFPEDDFIYLVNARKDYD